MTRVLALSGTGAVARLILRRDRIRIPIWVVSILVIVIVSALSIIDLYPTSADAENYVRLIEGNPAVVAFSGPGYGFDDPNQGVVFANESTMFTAVAFALMSVFMVSRHTRAEEEAERSELLRAGAVGRHAPLVATLAVVTGVNVVLAGAMALAISGVGLPTTGSVAFSVASVGAGLAFAGITAVAAQVATTGRGTLGLGCGALGVAFALRAVGDIGSGTLSWGSPIGWAQAVRPWADERWWVLLLLFGTTLALMVVAVTLETRRDLGGGFVPQRPGPRHANRWTTNPLGLAWRLQRGMLLGWIVGVVPMGAIYGSFARDVEQMLDDSPELADFLARIGEASVTDSYLATVLMLMALLVAGFAIASVLRMRTEEGAGRADPLLATPTSRITWLCSHLTITVGGVVILQLVTGITIGVGFAITTSESGEILRLTGAALVHVAPVLVLAGATMALYGLVPNAALASWATLVGAVLVGMFGELLRLPVWVSGLSPFEHAPGLPAETFEAGAVAALALVATFLFAIGIWGFRRRDLA